MGRGGTTAWPRGLLLSLSWRRPVRRAASVRAPFWLVVPEADTIAPVPAALEVARRAPGAELFRSAGGHYDVYEGGAGFADVLRTGVRPPPPPYSVIGKSRVVSNRRRSASLAAAAQGGGSSAAARLWRCTVRSHFPLIRSCNRRMHVTTLLRYHYDLSLVPIYCELYRTFRAEPVAIL
jgi:hypothetical protein